MANEAVVFVHSTGTGPILWAGVPQAAIGHQRTKRTPSNLGYAPNPLIERGVRVAAQDDADHLLRFVREQLQQPSDDQPMPIHIVAHSYGALIALLMMKVPEIRHRVRSVFFYEPVLFGALAATEAADPAAAGESRSFVGHPWFLHDEERLGRSEWLEMFIDYWNRPGSWARMPQEMREQQLAVGWKMSQEVRAVFFDKVSFEEWTKILDDEIPTTIMFGERSTSASRAMSQLLARGGSAKADAPVRSNITLVEAPGLNHMAPLVAPAAVHEEIARHFARQDERP